MKPKRNMIELSVSYDGTISVKNIEPCAIQRLYYIKGNEHGMMYHCYEDKKEYYLRRILNFMKKEVDKEYKEAKAKRDRIYLMIQEVNKNDKRTSDIKFDIFIGGRE